MSFDSILDRDILGSARARINANSNFSLTQPPAQNTYRTLYTGPTPLPYTTTTTASYQYFGGGPPATDNFESKKAFTDLQEQLRMMKKDAEKKDELIKELSLGNRHVHFEKDRYDPYISQDRTILDGTRRELEQYRLKVDTLSHDLRDANIKLSAKDERMNELRQETESTKKDHELLFQINNQLRARIRELESNMNSYDTVTNKSSLTISSLQKELKEKQDQLFDLQSRIRTHMEERETNERKFDGLHRRLHELFTSLSVTLGGDYGHGDAAAFDKVITRIADINAENTLLKGQKFKIEEANRNLEAEVKANRATLEQMTNHLQSFDRNHYGHRTQIDSIRAERDAALNDKENMKHELETVKSRLETIQKAWQNAQGELDHRETRFSSTELHFKQMENDLNYTKSCFDAFKQQIGQLLSDGYVKVEAKEEEIKEKIRLLMQSSKDRGIIITTLQNQKEQLAKQIQDQLEMNKDVDKKRRHQETHLYDLEQRMKTMDSNYTSTEVIRENFKQEQAKFYHFLERLALILKIENYSNEFNRELNPDVLLSRAEQLVKLENESIMDQKNSTYNYQRKMQQLKEQLENKEVHLDLLRKKLAGLEDNRTNKGDLEREIDNHAVLSRKMKTKVETLTQQINDLRHENAQLKNQMTDNHTFKDRLIEREKEIRRLLDEISKLENTRDKQAVKIISLQERMHSVDGDVSRTLMSSDNAVRTLSNELRFLKGSLAQLTEREQRLLDFRALIARMLGLDAKTLSVPDYEITARLERLLHVVQPNIVVPAVQIPNSTNALQHHVHHHRQPMQSAQGRRRRSPLSPNSRRTEASQRARSLSPLHVGLDPRTY